MVFESAPETQMKNSQYARLLQETSALLEISGGNQFKVRAYASAARAVLALPRQLDELIDADKVTSIKGIGKSIAENIGQIRATGSFLFYDELRGSLPEKILELTRVQGLGPRKVKTLYEKLGIEDLEGLESAVDEGRISTLAGFGKKSQENKATAKK